MPGDSEALGVVEGVVRQWMDGIKQQDATVMSQLFTEDAHFFLEGVELKGKKAIHDFFQGGFDAGWAENSAPVTEAGFAGDTAYGVGTSVNKDAQGEVTSETNWMAVYKQVGGEWKHHSLVSVNKPMSEGTESGDAMLGGNT